MVIYLRELLELQSDEELLSNPQADYTKTTKFDTKNIEDSPK